MDATPRGRVMAGTRLETEAKTIAWAKTLQPIVAEITAAGTTSKTGIANELNRRGVPALRGGSWTHVRVGKLLGWINLGAAD